MTGEPETFNVKMDMDHQTARLIIETAEWMARSVPKERPLLELSPELIKHAADLVFLAMALIVERKEEVARDL